MIFCYWNQYLKKKAILYTPHCHSYTQRVLFLRLEWRDSGTLFVRGCKSCQSSWYLLKQLKLSRTDKSCQKSLLSWRNTWVRCAFGNIPQAHSVKYKVLPDNNRLFEISWWTWLTIHLKNNQTQKQIQIAGRTRRDTCYIFQRRQPNDVNYSFLDLDLFHQGKYRSFSTSNVTQKHLIWNIFKATLVFSVLF